MRPTRFPALPLIGIAALFLATTAGAQQTAPRSGEAPPMPPPEAFQACKSLTLGAACEVATPEGTVKGDCWTPESGKPLACRPKDPPPQRGDRAGKKPKGHQ